MKNSLRNNTTIITFMTAIFFYDANLVAPHINYIINSISNANPILIATAVSFRKISRIILEIPIGKFIDRKIPFGFNILLAFLLKLVFFFLLSSNLSYMNLIALLCIETLSLNMFRGKVGIVQYRILEAQNRQKIMSLMDSIQSLLLYIFTLVCTYSSIKMYKTKSFNQISNTSALILLIPILLISFTLTLLPKQKKAKDDDSSKTNISPQNLSGKINIFKLPKSVIGKIIILSTSCLGWEISSINQFLAINTIEDSRSTAVFFQYGIICMLFGTIISFATNKLIEYQKMIHIAITSMLLILIFSFTLPKSLLFYATFIYLILFIPYANIASRELIKSLPQNNSNQIMSLATIFISATSIVLQFTFHIISNQYGFRVGHFIVFTTLLSLTITGVQMQKKIKLN